MKYEKWEKNKLKDVGQFRKEENRKMLNSYIGRKKIVKPRLTLSFISKIHWQKKELIKGSRDSYAESYFCHCTFVFHYPFGFLQRTVGQ